MSNNRIKIEFREPRYGKSERSVLYVNEERFGFVSFKEENEIRERIYNILSEFSQKQKTLKTMRQSK